MFIVLTVCEIVVFAAFLLSLQGALRDSRRGIHGKETALSLLSLEYRRYRGLGALWCWYSIGATLLNLLWWGVYYWVGGYSAPASLGLTAYETVRVLYVLFAFVAACRCAYCHWRARRFKPERRVGEREVTPAAAGEGLLLGGWVLCRRRHRVGVERGRRVGRAGVSRCGSPRRERRQGERDGLEAET